MKRVVITILLVIFTSVFVNYFISEPRFSISKEDAKRALELNKPGVAESIYFKLLERDLFNIEFHRNYINAHFQIPASKDKNRDDKEILDFYNKLNLSNDSVLNDIACYALGLIHVNKNDLDTGLEYFNKVKNRNLKFLNNSIGFVYLKNNDTSLAINYFKKEIECNGNIESAYYNLSSIFYRQKKNEELRKLIYSDAYKYIPSYIKQEFFFKNGSLIKYFRSYIESLIGKINFWGFIAAVAIAIVWVVFLVLLDIYEREKWYYIFLALAMGMFFTFFTGAFYEFYSLFLNFNLNGNLLNDFLYCWFGIGLIEELIKIIPFLILLRYYKMINESYDYILYASLTALGFAFIENIMYFESNHLHIIHGRALSSSLGHMFFSSLLAYGIYYNSYKLKKNKFVMFVVFLLIASFAHGFYDFWLINKTASSFSILTILLVLSSVFVWNYFVNNALNNSCFYDNEKKYFHGKLISFLLISLTSIFLLEYFILSIKYGPSAGNGAFIKSAVGGSYLLLFYATKLGRLNIRAGHWNAFGYSSVFKVIPNDESYDNALGLEFRIDSFSANPLAVFFFPNKIKLVKRITISNEQDWYLAELNQPAKIKSFDSSFIIIRTKDKKVKIERGDRYIADAYIIENLNKLTNSLLQRCDFKYIGWIVMK